jgi:O-succinylbenzoic acid--CoA ligase
LKNKPFHINFKLQEKTFNTVEELLIFSKELSEDIFSFLELWFNEKDTIEVKTSGSTGKPKRILLKKEYMINSALATGNFFNLFENTKALLCLPVNFIAGKMMLVRALTLGWELNFVAPISNPLKNIKSNYDFAAMVPLQLENSLVNISKIKKLIVGGASVSNNLLNKLQKIETEVFATYGMTETITHIAVKKLNNFKSGILQEKEKEYYSILPNIKISKDERGCLIIDASKLSSEKIITNDLVEIISPTKFKWLGRLDTIINSGGIKLIPEQIEEKLTKIIEQRFFVAGIPDAILGEKLIMIIEAQKEEFYKNELFQKIKHLKSLSKYEIPKKIYFVNQFVETETKKVNKNKTLKLILFS